MVKLTVGPDTSKGVPSRTFTIDSDLPAMFAARQLAHAMGTANVVIDRDELNPRVIVLWEDGPSGWVWDCTISGKSEAWLLHRSDENFACQFVEHKSPQLILADMLREHLENGCKGDVQMMSFEDLTGKSHHMSMLRDDFIPGYCETWNLDPVKFTALRDMATFEITGPARITS